MAQNKVVFLFDVDNTLLDNDGVIADLMSHLETEVGREQQVHYFRIFEQLRDELGYADYLGALQRYRMERPHDFHIVAVSLYLIDYPFAKRLFPHSLDVLDRFAPLGLVAILSDGDVVFQPHKVERAGLLDAVEKRSMIYVHKEKELDDVEARFPADHYVLIDDKLRILAAVKNAWAKRVTTVFVRQGHYALDADEVAKYPPADVSLDRIGDLMNYDAPALIAAAR